MPMLSITPEKHQRQVYAARAELQRALVDLEDAKKACTAGTKHNESRAHEMLQRNMHAVDQRAAALATLLVTEKALTAIPALHSSIADLAMVDGVQRRAHALGAGSRYLGLLLAEADADMIGELSPAMALASRKKVEALIEKLKLDPNATL